jgi:hypothetical protein
MSSTKSAVIGSTGVEVLNFEVKADNDASDLTVDEIKVKGVVVDKSSTATAAATASAATADDLLATADATGVAANGYTVIIATGGADTTGVVISGETASTITATVETDGGGAADPTWSAVVTALNLGGTFAATLSSPANGADTVLTADAQTLTLAGGVDAANDGTDTEANQTRINAVYLYQDDTLLDKVSGSQLASGVATFNGFKINVPKNSSKRFMVKADFIDDTNQGNDTVQFQLTGYSVEDDESDNVYTSTDRDSDGDLVDQSAQITSARVVTIKGVGTLANAVDTTDSEVDKDKNILGGVTSGFVASYELTATNEAIEIKDFTLTNTNGVLSNAVSEVIVYANDKTTEVARETVVSGVETVTFDNANFVVAEGTSNVYVKVITHKQGKDQAGQQTADLAFTLTITDAE